VGVPVGLWDGILVGNVGGVDTERVTVGFCVDGFGVGFSVKDASEIKA